MSKMYPFELSTLPDGLDGERGIHVAAYPTQLSAADLWMVEDAGLTIGEIDQVAAERHWPRPLSIHPPTR